MTSADIARTRLGIRRFKRASLGEPWNNTRRVAEYVARRDGQKPAVIQLWRMP